ncbi:MAG: response regulator transcription factor [Candidatus Hodarchaeales archaeon]|jgi:CheY-like chemotaxis protein
MGNILDDQGELDRKKVRVFIVEDEPQLITVMKMHLVRLKKYLEENIFSASNGQEALDKIEEFIVQEKTPHIIYADLRMPKLDGAKFFTELEKKHQDKLRKTVKIILTGISLSEEKAYLETTLNESDVLIVYKPFKYSELIANAEESLKMKHN